MPREWLGDTFWQRAETLRRTNERAWRNEYMGEITGAGGQVFENVRLREISDDEIDRMEWFYQGIDWGWFPDPFQWVRVSFDRTRRVLYIVDEYRAWKLGNQDTFAAVRGRFRPEETVIADSAEPKSIQDYYDMGCYQIRGANKASVSGKGSVAYSMKWLASLAEIVIDPERCPFAAQEFTAYEYESDGRGHYVSGFVDRDNHAIDAVRYAMSPVWRSSE